MGSTPVGGNNILRNIGRRVAVCMEGMMGVARGVRTRPPCIVVVGTPDTAAPAIDTVVDLLERCRLWACHF